MDHPQFIIEHEPGDEDLWTVVFYDGINSEGVEMTGYTTKGEAVDYMRKTIAPAVQEFNETIWI